jgi:hypothetical protein
VLAKGATSHRKKSILLKERTKGGKMTEFSGEPGDTVTENTINRKYFSAKMNCHFI